MGHAVAGAAVDIDRLCLCSLLIVATRLSHSITQTALLYGGRAANAASRQWISAQIITATQPESEERDASRTRSRQVNGKRPHKATRRKAEETREDHKRCSEYATTRKRGRGGHRRRVGSGQIRRRAAFFSLVEGGEHSGGHSRDSDDKDRGRSRRRNRCIIEYRRTVRTGATEVLSL
jgi:hypothetical protein